MSGLAKIQKDFCQFVLGHGHKDLLHHIKPTNLQKEELLKIYHHNVFSVHKQSLKGDYPLVFSILGEDLATKVAYDYIETGLPCMGSLEDWGSGFISFIQRNESRTTWPYLSEIAQFEWAKHMAYCAKEDPLLTPEDMQALIAPDQKDLNFQFQDSCHLMAFSHPLEQIISLHQKGEFKSLTELKGSSYVLILKHQGQIKVHWLEAPLFVFLNRLKEGQDIEVAYAAAQVLEPHFDAQEAFSFMLMEPILHR